MDTQLIRTLPIAPWVSVLKGFGWKMYDNNFHFSLRLTYGAVKCVRNDSVWPPLTFHAARRARVGRIFRRVPIFLKILSLFFWQSDVSLIKGQMFSWLWCGSVKGVNIYRVTIVEIRILETKDGVRVIAKSLRSSLAFDWILKCNQFKWKRRSSTFLSYSLLCCERWF